MGLITDVLRKYKETTDKETLHSYGETYDEIFKKFLDKPITLLEIGVQDGGSIMAWVECFPNANVIGVDVDMSRFNFDTTKFERLMLLEDNIRNVDVSDLDLDIVIDDGSHLWGDVLNAYQNLFPKLNKGGIYVIEDVQDIDMWEVEIKKLVDPKDRLWCVDLREVKGRSDDYLIIIEKK